MNMIDSIRMIEHNRIIEYIINRLLETSEIKSSIIYNYNIIIELYYIIYYNIVGGTYGR